MMNRLIKGLAMTAVILSCTLTSFAKNPLIAAVEAGELPKVQKMINSGIDVNTRDAEGNTSLHIAALYGNIEMMKWLMEHKANINAKNNLGRSPYVMWFRFTMLPLPEKMQRLREVDHLFLKHGSTDAIEGLEGTVGKKAAQEILERVRRE